MTDDIRAEAIRVLHLEDNEADHLYVREALVAEGLRCDVELVKTRTAFEAALRKNRYDVIVSDYSLPSFDGMTALSLAKEASPETPFLFFSATIGEELAVDSLKGGAVDYVLKQRPHRLIPAILRALKDAADRARLRQAEERIREQAALLDKASDAIIVCDLQRRVHFWNQGAARIYGWSAREAEGRLLDDLLSWSLLPLEIQSLMVTLEQRGEWSGEIQNATRNGRTVIVQSRATLIRDENNHPKSLLIINTDVTDRRQLEEQFLRAQRLESLGVLISGIAHDLNNALAPVLMGTSVLRAQPRPEDMAPVLDMIETSARRGAEMVRQVLAFARGTESRKSFMRVDQLVKEVGRIIADVFPKKIKCRTVNEGDWIIAGNATQLHQVLMNLCVNARDAMPAGGTLTLSTRNVQLEPSDLSVHPEARPGRYVCL
ncbi:MAG TPA: PAS domain S-box protein, partial [Verrucomicrobiota bacterium]|nr:PAS domain S-box protein [Verrucomicrobiota bacterium]